MKKLILLCLLSLSSISFSITPIESPDIIVNEKSIGESYIAKFDSANEKQMKMTREKKYLQSKEEFKVFTDKGKKGGVMYMASYSTPVGYLISFKGFCGDKYISVNGDYNNFDELLQYFLQKTDEAGYNFR